MIIDSIRIYFHIQSIGINMYVGLFEQGFEVVQILILTRIWPTSKNH